MNFFFLNIKLFFICKIKLIFMKKNFYTKKIYTIAKKFYTLQKCAQTKLWHVQKVAFVFLCTVQICDFCIWKIICAADLRILCTTVFCTFADLHICVLHICRKFANMCEMFLHIVRFVKTFCKCARTCEFFFLFFHRICKFEQKVSKCRKSRNFRKCPENVRKKLTCSWVVHEWFLGQRVWQHRVAKVARICIN